MPICGLDIIAKCSLDPAIAGVAMSGHRERWVWPCPGVQAKGSYSGIYRRSKRARRSSSADRAVEPVAASRTCSAY